MKYEISLLMENLSLIDDENYFMEELNNFIGLIDNHLTDKELNILLNLLENKNEEVIDELLLEQLNMTVRVAPPHWIAISGSKGLSKWDEISQAYTSSSGKTNYHKSISEWKNWESLYHDKPRLKADKKIKMVDQVKERFKNDLKEEKEKSYMLVYKKGSINDLKLLDKDGEQLGYFHTNAKYLSDIAPEYKKLTNKDMIKGLFKTAIKEKKAKLINDNQKKELFNNPNDYIAIIISEAMFKEFTSRTYFAYKHYLKKK